MHSSFSLDVGSNKIIALSLKKRKTNNPKQTSNCHYFIAFLLVFVLYYILWDHVEMEENVQLLLKNSNCISQIKGSYLRHSCQFIM